MIKIKPAEMTKISITGPKSQLETTIDTLHDLGLLHIEDYEGDLETGEPGDEAEELSELLVDIRSVISKLPEKEEKREEVQASVEEVQGEFEDIRNDVDRLKSGIEGSKREIKEFEEEKDFYRSLKGSGLDIQEVRETESLDVAVADFKVDGFKNEVDTDRYDIFRGSKASAVVFEKIVSAEVNSALQESGNVYSIPGDLREGVPSEALSSIESDIGDAEAEKEK
ncbi:MAG: hypothetical protein BRC26_04095, partial [Nanohaloarchaea archaeon QH_8_44_6]